MRNFLMSVEECGGDRFQNLEAAQMQALRPLAMEFVIALRSLLAEGMIAQEDDREQEAKQEHE